MSTVAFDVADNYCDNVADKDGDDVLLFCRTSTCVVVVPAANIGPPSAAHTHNLSKH